MPIKLIKKNYQILFFVLLATFWKSIHGNGEEIVFFRDHTIPVECSSHWDLSLEKMYGIAFKWTHEHKLEKWKYLEIQKKKFKDRFY